MLRRLIAPGLAAATALVVMAGTALTPVRAADLYDQYAPQRSGSAYDDPRYADLYGNDPPRPRTYAYRPDVPPPPPAPPRSYGYSYQPVPIPKERVYRDTDRDYGRDYGRNYRDERGHRDYDPRRTYSSSRGGCPSKDAIRDRLQGDGWGDFHGPNVVDDREATVKARRPNGRLFELTLDRCTGVVLELRPLEGRQYGSYVDRGRSRW